MSFFRFHPSWAVLAAAALCAGTPAEAQLVTEESAPVEIRQVEMGYGGVCKSGYWTPIWLTLRARQSMRGNVEIIAPDGDGVPCAFAPAGASRGSPHEFAAGVDQSFSIDVKLGPQQSALSVRVRDPGTGAVIWQAGFPPSVKEPLPATSGLVVSIGDSAAVQEAAALLPNVEGHRIVAAALTDPARVPDVWWGFEGVSTIVLPTGPGSIHARLSTAQLDALKQWVEIGGGRLVVCVGERGHEVFAADSRLAGLAPGKFVDVGPLRDLSKFEELTGQPPLAKGDAARPRVTRLTDVQGRVEATVAGLSGDLPLLIRASHGFGEVVFLGVDADGPVMEQWPGRGRLLAAALTDPSRNRSDGSGLRRGSRLGYDDIIGQLRMAMDHFPGVRVINITTVALLTLAYLALIGPADFLLERRRRWPGAALTWFTFPLTAVVFCAVAWYVGQGAHGSAPKANLAEIIDIDAERQIVRGTVWVHLYGGRTSVHDVSLAVRGTPVLLQGSAHGWLTWQGLPGEGLGGLGANQLAQPRFAPYATSPPGSQLALAGLPIQVAGSKAIAARWWGAANIAEKSSLALSPYDLLEGEVVNPLDVDLVDCLLVYDEWLYRLKTLSPGQRVRLADFDPLNLEARLQQRTIAHARDVISPWEADGTDVPQIMQMIMFHESARGSNYTKLGHQYQGYLDLTPRARNGRAILVGRIAQQVSQLSLDGQPFATYPQDEPWTWVRVVLPVATRRQP